MEHLLTISLTTLPIALFGAVLIMHVSSHKIGLTNTYLVQSAIVALLLATLAVREHSWTLFFVAIATSIVKCFIVPGVLFRLIRKLKMKFFESTYFTIPMILFFLLIMVLSIRSSLMPLFVQLVPGNENSLLLAIAAFFASLLFAMNHKGAFAQIMGILSAENSLVVFAALLHIHVQLWLELGILADVLAWILLGTAFVTIVSKHFGTTDVSRMKELAE